LSGELEAASPTGSRAIAERILDGAGRPVVLIDGRSGAGKTTLAQRLAPLLELPGERGRDLLDTLEAYLHAGGRKTETAAALGIERQSLYHRLGRIEEILDVDLRDGDTVLALHLAVMVRRHLHR